VSTYSQLNHPLKSAGWKFGGGAQTFPDCSGKLVALGRLLKLVPATTEAEFAAWAEDSAIRIARQ
jgi:hypothetical protein